MITAYLTTHYGPRVAQWIARAVVVLLLLAILTTAVTCYRGQKSADRARQADQTVKTVTAHNKAAGEAVNTVSDRVAAEQAIDADTIRTQEVIRNAETSDQVHDAVVDIMCRRLRENGRNDPACKLR